MSGNLSLCLWFRRWGCTHFQIKKNAGALAASAGRQLFFVSSAVWNAGLWLVLLGLSTLWRHREKGKALSNQRSRKSVIAEEASLADAGRRTHCWWITPPGSFKSHIFKSRYEPVIGVYILVSGSTKYYLVIGSSYTYIAYRVVWLGKKCKMFSYHLPVNVCKGFSYYLIIRLGLHKTWWFECTFFRRDPITSKPS